MADFKVITSDFVNVHISTCNNEISDVSFAEKRFAKDLTVQDLKAKLELMTGGNCNTMQLEVYDKDKKFVCNLGDDGALLGSYPVEDGMRIHVIDQFSIRNELTGSNVEKFELAPEIYAKRTDTVRAFLVKNKMGHYNEEYNKRKQQQGEEERKLAESMAIGSRCQVTIPNAPQKLGTVLYTGEVEGLTGHWIGVKYDEPLGKNDGSFKGKSYFTCEQNYGAFVRPHHVFCGEFPEETYNLDEEI